jgi:hypothetical protein
MHKFMFRHQIMSPDLHGYLAFALDSPDAGHIPYPPGANSTDAGDGPLAILMASARLHLLYQGR